MRPRSLPLLAALSALARADIFARGACGAFLAFAACGSAQHAEFVLATGDSWEIDTYLSELRQKSIPQQEAAVPAVCDAVATTTDAAIARSLMDYLMGVASRGDYSMVLQTCIGTWVRSGCRPRSGASTGITGSEGTPARATGAGGGSDPYAYDAYDPYGYFPWGYQAPGYGDSLAIAPGDGFSETLTQLLIAHPLDRTSLEPVLRGDEPALATECAESLHSHFQRDIDSQIPDSVDRARFDATRGQFAEAIAVGEPLSEEFRFWAEHGTRDALVSIVGEMLSLGRGEAWEVGLIREIGPTLPDDVVAQAIGNALAASATGEEIPPGRMELLSALAETSPDVVHDALFAVLDDTNWRSRVGAGLLIQALGIEPRDPTETMQFGPSLGDFSAWDDGGEEIDVPYLRTWVASGEERYALPATRAMVRLGGPLAENAVAEVLSGHFGPAPGGEVGELLRAFATENPPADALVCTSLLQALAPDAAEAEWPWVDRLEEPEVRDCYLGYLGPRPMTDLRLVLAALLDEGARQGVEAILLGRVLETTDPVVAIAPFVEDPEGENPLRVQLRGDLDRFTAFADALTEAIAALSLWSAAVDASGVNQLFQAIDSYASGYYDPYYSYVPEIDEDALALALVAHEEAGDALDAARARARRMGDQELRNHALSFVDTVIATWGYTEEE